PHPRPTLFPYTTLFRSHVPCGRVIMPINPRLLIAAVTALCACALLAPARSLRGAESPTRGASAAALIEKLGLHVAPQPERAPGRSEEHTSELQSRRDLV